MPPRCRYVDALEKQVNDVQVRNRDLIRAQPMYAQRPAYGAQRPDLSNALAAERHQREAALEGQRALQSEIMRLQEEKQEDSKELAAGTNAGALPLA